VPHLRIADSITDAIGDSAGAVIVTGSHGGVSAGRFALQARPLAVVFNDAGVGKDQAGVQALALLQGHGMAACTVSHTTARIGDARSTLDEGLISHANAAARSLGAREGTPCREWVEVLLSRAA
jgi:hypothetical protein